MNKNKKQFAIFIGGETAGPVVPLLALADEWCAQDPNICPIFLDRKKSVAARMVPLHGYEFRTMTSGKFRRYFSFKNFLSPLLIIIGIIRSLYLLTAIRPIVVIGAGGYVQVPVIVAAWMLGIPRVIHQQDIVVTFSNKLVAPFANKITTTFEKSVKDFSEHSGFQKVYSDKIKTVWIGNPSALSRSADSTKKAEGIELFKLQSDFPTVLVIGGGSGAMGLNQAVAHNLPDLLRTAQVIHSTGPGKRISTQFNSPELHSRYHQYEFIDRMDLAYATADIVIARAGIGTITELSVLSKMSVIVPMPNSHQEVNAHYLFERKAAIVLDQTDITPDKLSKVVKKIMFDLQLQKELHDGISSIMPRDATQKMLDIILSLVHGKK